MKRFLVLMALTTSSFAQTTVPEAGAGAGIEELPPPAPKESHWQNWVYAGTAIAIAIIGVTAVSLSEGHAKPAP